MRIQIKHLPSFLCISLFVVTNTFAQLENRYNELLALVKISNPNDSNPEAPKKENIDISFGKISLSQQTIFEKALYLMAENDDKASLCSNVFFPTYAWESLHLVTGEQSVLHALGKPHTVFGKLFLAKTLTLPTQDIKQIQKRQRLIAYLLAHPTIHGTIEQAMTKIGELQEHLLNLGDNMHPLYSDDMQLYHHKWILRRPAPNNRFVQNIAKLAGDIWFVGGPLLMTASAVKLGLLTKNNSMDTLKGRLNLPEKVIQYGSYAFAGYSLFNAINTLPWGIRRIKALHYMYHQLKPLTTFFQLLQSLQKMCREIEPLADLADEIDFIISQNNEYLIRLKTLLDGPAFQNPLFAQIYGGDVVMAVSLLKKCHSSIFKGVGLIGALDMYSSLTRWFAKGINPENPTTCFASFVSREKPQLTIHNFWHPLLSQKPVYNTVTLGGSQNPQNMVVTGLFESGKSILLHSITLTVLCAQTIGICPTKFYEATPFAAINVYANIKDDLANDRSLFRTELYRALTILRYIQSLPPDRFSFSITDATFTGTEAGAGQAAAYAVAKHLTTLPQSIAIHATNFLSMALLGIENPTACANYYLPTSYNGSAKHSYQLTPGLQTSDIATIIFEEENMPQRMLAAIKAQLKRTRAQRVL